VFCIFCGAPATGITALSCSQCGRVHYLQSKLGSSALVVDSGRYLVVRRAREPFAGYWDVPGGFCEYGEHPAAAAERETLEETGLAIRATKLLGVWMDSYADVGEPSWPTVNFVYLSEVVPSAATDEAPAFPTNEVSAVSWFPLEQPPADMAFPTQQRGALEALRSQRPSA
jgi:8-oxo-dGTP diphosphatase